MLLAGDVIAVSRTGNRASRTRERRVCGHSSPGPLSPAVGGRSRGAVQAERAHPAASEPEEPTRSPFRHCGRPPAFEQDLMRRREAIRRRGKDDDPIFTTTRRPWPNPMPRRRPGRSVIRVVVLHGLGLAA